MRQGRLIQTVVGSFLMVLCWGGSAGAGWEPPLTSQQAYLHEEFREQLALLRSRLPAEAQALLDGGRMAAALRALQKQVPRLGGQSAAALPADVDALEAAGVLCFLHAYQIQRGVAVCPDPADPELEELMRHRVSNAVGEPADPIAAARYLRKLHDTQPEKASKRVQELRAGWVRETAWKRQALRIEEKRKFQDRGNKFFAQAAALAGDGAATAKPRTRLKPHLFLARCHGTGRGFRDLLTGTATLDEVRAVLAGEQPPRTPGRLSALEAAEIAVLGDTDTAEAGSDTVTDQALRLCLRERAEDNFAYLGALVKIGTRHLQRAQLGQAEACFRAATKGYENKYGTASLPHAAAATLLAETLWRQGDTAGAEPFAFQASQVWRQQFGDKAAETLKSGILWASICLERGKVKEAEKALAQYRDIALANADQGKKDDLFRSLNPFWKSHAQRAADQLALWGTKRGHRVQVPNRAGPKDSTYDVHARMITGVDDRYDRSEPPSEPLAGESPVHQLVYAVMEVPEAEVERSTPFKKFIDSGLLKPDDPHSAQSLAEAGRVLGATQRWAQANLVYDSCNRWLRSGVNNVLHNLSTSGQLSVLTNLYRPMWHESLAYAVARREESGMAARSASWVLNGKAQLQEILAERVLLGKLVLSPAQQETLKQLVAVRARLAELAALPTPDQQKQAELERKEADLSYELGRQRPLSRQALEPWLELERVQLALPTNTVLVELVRMDDPKASTGARYAAWVVPPTGQAAQLFDLGEAGPIDAAVAACREALEGVADNPGDTVGFDEAKCEKQLRQKMQAVSQRVLQPLEAHLARYSEWVISPDGPLWLVPWAALPLSNNTYAVEAHTLRTVISGRDLIRHRAPLAQGPPVVFANPDFAHEPVKGQAVADLSRSSRGSASSFPPEFGALPSTQTEVETLLPELKKYVQGECAVHLSREASESRLKQVRQPRLMVLATHGIVLADPPANTSELTNPLLRTGIALAGANRRDDPSMRGSEDGIVTGLEILGLDLRGTELVVLSACQTGLGKVQSGEGVAGLRQAFQLAGAGSVLASLWSVDDAETAQLMQFFWKALAAGSSHAEAIAAAQRHYLKQRRQQNRGAAHPYYWAAFSLTGSSFVWHPTDPVSLVDQADQAHRKGDRAAAQRLYRQALTAYTGTPGRHHLKQVAIYEKMASIEEELAQPRIAAAYYREAYELLQNLPETPRERFLKLADYINAQNPNPAWNDKYLRLKREEANARTEKHSAPTMSVLPSPDTPVASSAPSPAAPARPSGSVEALGRALGVSAPTPQAEKPKPDGSERPGEAHKPDELREAEWRQTSSEAHSRGVRAMNEQMKNMTGPGAQRAIDIENVRVKVFLAMVKKAEAGEVKLEELRDRVRAEMPSLSTAEVESLAKRLQDGLQSSGAYARKLNREKADKEREKAIAKIDPGIGLRRNLVQAPSFRAASKRTDQEGLAAARQDPSQQPVALARQHFRQAEQDAYAWEQRSLYEAVSQCLRLQVKLTGENHLDTAFIRHVLGWFKCRFGDKVGARREWEQALRLREKHLGAQHADTQTTRQELTALFRVLGDEASAQACAAGKPFAALPANPLVVEVKGEKGSLSTGNREVTAVYGGERFEVEKEEKDYYLVTVLRPPAGKFGSLDSPHYRFLDASTAEIVPTPGQNRDAGTWLVANFTNIEQVQVGQRVYRYADDGRPIFMTAPLTRHRGWIRKSEVVLVK